MSGSALAVSGATAPFRNDVVVVVGAAGIAAAGLGAGALTGAAATVSTTVLGTPAAESTHALMSLSVTRVTLSERAFVSATITAFAESTFAVGCAT